MKHVSIAKTDAGTYEVRVVEDVYGRPRIKRRTVCETLQLARNVAQSLSITNGRCEIKELAVE